jgi:hypothetical protein
MKISLRNTTRMTRRWLLCAVGSLSVVAAAGRSAAAPDKPLCVECLAKRARQRTAFVSKWV